MLGLTVEIGTDFWIGFLSGVVVLMAFPNLVGKAARKFFGGLFSKLSTDATKATSVSKLEGK